MKFFHIIILMLLLSMSLDASETHAQIIITKTSKQSNLDVIKQRLNALNIKMFVQKVDSYYVVYSQKYNNMEEANKSLQMVKNYFPYARFVNIETTHEEEKKTTTEEATISTDKNNFFIALGVSLSSLSGTTTDANASNLNNSGVSYALEGGYRFDENIFTTIGYIDSSTSDINVQNIYASLNYQLNFTDDFGVYGGAIGGFSSLKLTGYTTTTSSTSMLIGGQIGSQYRVTDYFSIYSSYKLLIINHTILLNNTADLKFTFLNNLQVGVEFKF